MREGVDLDRVFGALSDPTRREILTLLRGGERSTGSLAAGFAVTRPAVSRHLQVLVDAGLVERRKEGRHQLYRVAAPPLVEASEWLQSHADYWRGALRRLKAHLEEEAGGSDE